jgi:nucleotide-binding universal stress UspA family protein
MTQSIDTILVPLELADNAQSIVEWALDWASMKRARIVLLHAVPPVHAYTNTAFADPMTYGEYYTELREAARKRLLPLANLAEAEGVSAAVQIRIGSPAEQILAAASELGAGLIVLGTHGRRGLAHVVLGSTAEKVVRLAECPVFVVKERRAPKPVEKVEPAIANVG